MKKDYFDDIVSDTLSVAVSSLSKKALEYAPEQDRLEQFKIDAITNDLHPITIAMVHLSKQLSAIKSIVKHIESGKTVSSWVGQSFDERVNDVVSYAILIKCLFIEIEDSESKFGMEGTDDL